MAAAIISGLLTKSFPATQITVSEPWAVNRDKIAALGVHTTTSNPDAARAADILILAIKPQVAKTVCRDLAAHAEAPLPLIVSIVAGVTAASLREWCGGATAEGASSPVVVVRVMPNTPALLGEGASAVFAGEDVSALRKALVGELMGSVSRAIEWVDREELLDVVTGLSGSGPAYFFVSRPFGAWVAW
jgi:pyrroline-5-carboxylate reductase